MLAILVVAASCAAPPVIPVAGDHARLDAHVEYLRDPQRGYTLEEIARPPLCNEFKATRQVPSFGDVAAGVWLRFRLAAAADDWRLTIPFAPLARACVHWPVAGKGKGKAVRSECRNRNTAEDDPEHWREAHFAYAMPADVDRAGTIHVYVESDVWLKVPLELATREAVLASARWLEFGWGLYYGILLAIVLVSFAVYIGRRDRAFLYFSLQIGVLLVALAIWQGRLARWDPAGWSFVQLTPTLLGLFFVLGAAFFQRFLETAQNAPVAHKLLGLSLWLALGLAAIQPRYPELGARLLGFNALLWIVASLGAAATRLKQGYRPALAVLAAMAVLLAGIFFNAVEVIGVPLLDADLSLTLAYAGALVAAGFLVFGLVVRLRGLVEERDRASQLAQTNQQLALHRARFDEITGLPNRAKFREDLRDRIAQAASTGKALAVLTIGLDRFRQINHALGHEGGDAVLAEISLRLRDAVVPEDQLARLGADTFALLTPLRPGGLAELKARATLLRKTLATPLLRGGGATVTASIGVAAFPEHALTVDALLRFSDEALYFAKERGAGLEVYDPALQHDAERYLELNKDLRHALLSDALELHYQPLRTLAGGKLAGVEALLRWKRNGQYVPPDQFIPIAEASDLMLPLTDWVFRRACRQALDWRQRSVEVPAIAVNVSAHQFRLPGFVERVEAVLFESGLPGDALVLEITESVLLDDIAATRETLKRLGQRGVNIAVDDFGVGYSSLSYLRTLPVQSVKIDRSFLLGIPQESEAVSVIGAIIALGRDLKLKVTAEGIENQAQYDFLVRRGVNIGQGYWIARPMPPADLEAWLKRQQVAAA